MSKETFIFGMKGLNKRFKETLVAGRDLRRGFFTFYYTPLPADTEAAKDLVELISKLVTSIRPKVVVIDNYTVLSNATGNLPTTRSILQNLVNELASMIGGIIVIVAETSFNKKSID